MFIVYYTFDKDGRVYFHMSYPNLLYGKCYLRFGARVMCAPRKYNQSLMINRKSNFQKRLLKIDKKLYLSFRLRFVFFRNSESAQRSLSAHTSTIIHSTVKKSFTLQGRMLRIIIRFSPLHCVFSC